MSTLDALDYAAAALRDCRRAALQSHNTQLASTLFEALDHISHLRDCTPDFRSSKLIPSGTQKLMETDVPHETNGLAQTQQAPVVAVTLSH